MDPLLDEKFILTISQVLPDYIRNTLRISAIREAYGPSKNEGICFENCTKVAFEGEVNGAMFLCMDGYTKLKLLPKIADSFGIDPTTRPHSSSIVLEFANQISASLISEMKQGRFNIDILPPENLNHKLISVDMKRFRQYILIYFLTDKRGGINLGRMTLILLMEKFTDASKSLT
ncbi:chemotaxis protein CheX [Leptospira sp. GIMC2001]|uniref:chemotaxis protein CheX n=1 Tax=Leptospira sp. GIMC2001 TaxID=1513297 RepID=UPI00234B32D5|nr:chemotaxis protein CheX [Leptospira sp. GIMC2001]WCL50213.1 chemotaxis protein CheX [Leptospira sp. GIMC2001]